MKINTALPTDSPEIIRMVKMQYGDLNPNRKLYDKEYLFDAIKNGIYKFYICRNDFDEVVGIVCAKNNEMFPGCVEGCTLIVSPEYRGQGLAKELMRVMKSDIFQNSYMNVLIYNAITLDTISQKIEAADGFIPTGILLNRFKYDQETENLKNMDIPLRRHHLVMVKPIDKKITENIFVPHELESIVYDVYKKIGVKFYENKSEKSYRQLFDYPEHNYADFIGFLPDDSQMRESVNVWLNMNSGDCPALYEEAKKRGFVFSGIQPLSDKGEFLIMHRSGRFKEALHEAKTIPEFNYLKEVLIGGN
ncbi:MAG: GNAT family N-acetyltransferase [Clostridiales bacterium]|jgi:GNAT superfamily N-acetyltransferase|nr:GNAT family N-acetyltransferase [Clostridiales bacterium]